MSRVAFPAGFRLESLQREHPRKQFSCGEPAVDQWLTSVSFQHQKKHLSTTRVLLAPDGSIAGYYTLATGQIDFSELPDDLMRKLPRRQLPIAVLAWMGIDQNFQRQGLGERLLAQALRDCDEASQTFAFIAVLIDCRNDAAKTFYQRYNFEELPGHPYRLFLSAGKLKMLMKPS